MPDGSWLLDSSILIDLLRGFAPARNWLDSLSPGDRRISVVTAAELLTGCRNRREQHTVERELALYDVVLLDELASQPALDLYRQHHLADGTGFLDCLIAATAMTRGLRLATTNLRPFQPFGGLDSRRPY